MGLLAAGAVAGYLLIAKSGGAPTGPRIESLAVLPLENLSGDSQQDYLAAGMHEALILDLGRLSGLKRVSARGSVMRYQNTTSSPKQIGIELGVDALISGSVRRAGDGVYAATTVEAGLQARLKPLPPAVLTMGKATI